MIDFSTYDDAGLHELIAGATDELHQRALGRNDLDALLDEGFDVGFTSKGEAREPYLRGNVLVCPGSVVEKSAMSHDCVFVHIDDSWVWESPHLLLDSVRKIPDRARTHQRSVSLLAGVEGLRFDVIWSGMRQGVHAMKQARSYTIAGGECVLVSARAAAPAGIAH